MKTLTDKVKYILENYPTAREWQNQLLQIYRDYFACVYETHYKERQEREEILRRARDLKRKNPKLRGSDWERDQKCANNGTYANRKYDQEKLAKSKEEFIKSADEYAERMNRYKETFEYDKPNIFIRLLSKIWK